MASKGTLCWSRLLMAMCKARVQAPLPLNPETTASQPQHPLTKPLQAILGPRKLMESLREPLKLQV